MCGLSCLASILLFTSSTVAAPAAAATTTTTSTSIWHISIWKSPAPPADEGPALSATALRDPSKLKYEIVGIVGAYLVCVLVSLCSVLAIGRRLRRKIRTSNRSLKMEILKTAGDKTVLPGPKSPGKMATLKSWATGGRNNAGRKSDLTVASIDEKIVNMDRQKNLEDMTNLYAVVMAHDEAKSQSRLGHSHSSSLTPQSPVDMVYPVPGSPTYAMPSPPGSPQHPPEFQHLRSAVAQAQTGAQQGAQYQQHQHYQQQQQQQQQPLPPPPPIPPNYADDRSFSASRASTKQGTPLSLSSSRHSRSGSGQSTKPRPGHISIRGLPISKPMPSAGLTAPATYSAGLPMSPRLYNPGPPPPTPGQQRAAASGQYGDGPDSRTPRASVATAATPISATPTAAAPPRSAKPANLSNNSLPFRDLYGSNQDGLRTAPPTKTTFLSARESVLAHPKTGIPAVPYSPYTPFTPMTPITPRLLNKKEMRRKRKEDGMAVLSEDDMVKSDEEMWGP